MRIRCPYCDCHYDIHPDTLGEPIGHERLGFGWWLKCYQCQKKFWLKSTTVINTGFSPIKADRRKAIGKLSRFTQQKPSKKKHNKVAYIFILILLIIGAICYTRANDIRSFFIVRTKHLTTSTITGLQLSNVTYRIDKVNHQYRIAVMGIIVNNTSSVMSCNKLHVVLLSNNIEAASWSFVPDIKSIIPGDKTVFNTDRILSVMPKDMKVLVRIV